MQPNVSDSFKPSLDNPKVSRSTFEAPSIQSSCKKRKTNVETEPVINIFDAILGDGGLKMFTGKKRFNPSLTWDAFPKYTNKDTNKKFTQYPWKYHVEISKGEYVCTMLYYV